MFQLIRIARSNPVELDQHIEDPGASPIFNAYPRILADSEAVALICDTLRSASMNYDDPHQVEEVLTKRIEKNYQEAQHSAHTLQIMADGLPALGIVAAVLGVIKTMASIDQPPEILGKMIGGALVGTFLGVFLSYGLVGPFANRVKAVIDEDQHFYNLIREVMVAALHNHAPEHLRRGRAAEHAGEPAPLLQRARGRAPGLQAEPRGMIRAGARRPRRRWPPRRRSRAGGRADPRRRARRVLAHRAGGRPRRPSGRSRPTRGRATIPFPGKALAFATAGHLRACCRRRASRRSRRGATRRGPRVEVALGCDCRVYTAVVGARYPRARRRRPRRRCPTRAVEAPAQRALGGSCRPSGRGPAGRAPEDAAARDAREASPSPSAEADPHRADRARREPGPDRAFGRPRPAPPAPGRRPAEAAVDATGRRAAGPAAGAGGVRRRRDCRRADARRRPADGRRRSRALLEHEQIARHHRLRPRRAPPAARAGRVRCPRPSACPTRRSTSAPGRTACRCTGRRSRARARARRRVRRAGPGRAARRSPGSTSASASAPRRESLLASFDAPLDGPGAARRPRPRGRRPAGRARTGRSPSPPSCPGRHGLWLALGGAAPAFHDAEHFATVQAAFARAAARPARAARADADRPTARRRRARRRRG